MAEVRSKKQGGPAVDDGLIPSGIPEQLRQQILSEKDPEKKNTLISLAWDEAGNSQEPEFVSQGRKRAPKPKSTGSSTANSNGSHAVSSRGSSAEGKRPANGAKPAQDRKSGPRKGPGANPAAGDAKPKEAKPSTPTQAEAAKPAASNAPANATAIPTEVSGEASKAKASTPASGAAPTQSAWASGKPLSKKLSEKPEEEKRLAEEKAKAAEAAKLQETQRRAAAAEEQRRKKAEQAAQRSPPQEAAAPATSVAGSSPAPVEQTAPAEKKAAAPVTSYASAAKGAFEKKAQKAVSQPAPAVQPAAPLIAQPEEPETAPAPVPTVAAPAPAQTASEPVNAKPEPVTQVQTNVRVPQGFGETGQGKFTFGDFNVDSSSAAGKFGTAASTSSWGDDSKKSSDAANSAFINNLMAGSSSTSVSNLVASAPSVKEVESQLLSAAAGSNSHSQEASSEVPAAPLVTPAVAPVSVPSVSQPVSNVAPQSSNPLMMGNPSGFPRIPQGNMQMGGQMQPKKGGRGGQGAGMQGGRGGVLGAGMRVPNYPIDPYYYQAEHTQAGFGIPYGQAPSFAADPQMYGAAAQYGYGSEMGFYAQQQQQQQQQQASGVPTNAPPGLGGAIASSNQGSSGDFSTAPGQNASDMSSSASSNPMGAASHAQPLQQQGGYMQQPYSGGYGQSQSGFLQQQQSQQQQHAGAGSIGGQSQQQEPAAYPGTHPSSFPAAASYPQPGMYPYAYGSQMYYPQYNAYAPSTRYASAFPQPVQYGNAPMPQDQGRQNASAPYYGQGLSASAQTSDATAQVPRAGPPGYGAPSFAAQQQQQQQQPASESNWATQQEAYSYRPASNFYPQGNAGGSTGQEWRRQ